MTEGFPAVTTKRLAFKQVVAELLWFISGSQNVKDLQKLGCHIWDGNAYSDKWVSKAQFDGDVGRIYGTQWRAWSSEFINDDGKLRGYHIDQLKSAINLIKGDPDNRRIVVTARNPAELYKVCLPPCHMFFQFFVDDGKLSLQLYARTQDTALGTPFNIASYALLLYMVAQVTGLKAHEYIHTMGDSHIYFPHLDGVKEQLSRKPYKLPKLWINPEVKDIDSFTMDDFKLIDYKCHPKIKYEMIV